MGHLTALVLRAAAILSEGGLRPALNALARRSAVAIDLDLHLNGRLAEPVEMAAYHIVAEALATPPNIRTLRSCASTRQYLMVARTCQSQTTAWVAPIRHAVPASSDSPTGSKR
ncbi:hypothetical protein OHA72_57670 [Dactylosporangium sp. NBC_01737]|uniref:hypothetical protein n=1 Tax=Dactylosporangium sp. NBC_01737 TaxID=2975959 RepID=UPI002E1127DB|nr:hypothetical protein OHA72_57670 [Dactylosporangium sp. NBC_01737]